jgi:phosphatidylglycerol---prolipoprotein diacylglyceryl transferase
MFEALSFGPFLFWTHLAFLMIGVWLAAEFLFRLASSASLPLQHFRDHALWYLVAFILGGRLLSMISDYRVYLRDPLRSFILWDGHFSFLGAAFGIGLVLFVVTRLHRTTFLQWLDALLPATTLGLTFDWVGKFFAGQAYGKPTDVFWAITYDAIQVRYAVPIHPVQLYYALFFLLLTFLLLVVRKHTRRAGAETLLGVVLASLAVMVLEMFRGDGVTVFAMVSDFVVIALLFLSLGLLVFIELKLSSSALMLYGGTLLVLTVGYAILRQFLPYETFELRFSQFLSVLALFATVTYVIVHRRRYPHL